MNQVIVLAIGCVLFLGACGATQTRIARPGATSSPLEVAPAGKGVTSPTLRVEGATGDLREALLSLSRVHFGRDSSMLETSARDALADAAARLRRHTDIHLFVDGHADDRGTTQYNIALGERRAQAVISYLTSLGISPDRLRPVSKGEEFPIASGEGEQAWAANRRVEFRLLRGSVELELRDGLLLDDTGKPMESGLPRGGGSRPVAVR